MAIWKRSGLYKGQKVLLTPSVLIDSNGIDRHICTEYVGETPAGIMFELFFRPGFLSTSDKWSYRVFINWPSVYCGNIKIRTKDGSEVRAVREDAIYYG